MDSTHEPLNTFSLPEINLTTNAPDDWGFLTKPQREEEEEDALSSPPSPPSSAHENEIATTLGLKRALSLSTQSSDIESVRTEVINISTSNPSHLYWVPASQHPEIAPAEFEKYVQAHGLIVRKKSTKRQSILSMYFTANDQQKLEENHEEEEDANKRKVMLRRSLSLQLPPTNDFARNMPDLLVFDRNSSPFDESRALVPKGDRPLLRRGARTNFKRNSSVSHYRNSTIHKNESTEMPRSTSAEGITLDDSEIITEAVQEDTLLSPVVEEVRDLCISTRNDEATPPPVVMTRSVSTSTSRKSSWSWSFWSEKQHAEEPTKDSKRFTLSSLFSRKSKHPQHNYTTNIEKMTSHLNPPKDFQLNPMQRLPLHVERAIYKLSHFKLANPRRPLHEQVLISNHMFWYLSIIATSPQPPPKKAPRKRIVKKAPANTHFLAPQSTGFVVPENYLNPRKKQQSSDSSSSEEDDQDDDDSDQDVDDVPLAMYKLK